MRYSLPILLLLAALARLASSEPVVLRGAAQGTTYQLKIVQASKPINTARLRREVDRVLGEIDRQMSTYRDDSEISRFNRVPAGEWFAVSPAVVAVVTAARAISEKTDGAMDVTVGPLVRLWHFGPMLTKNDILRPSFEPPTADAIAKTRKHVGYKLLDVRANPPSLRKAADGVEVDLSSIASGWTIDRLAKLLVDRGITNYMVELGGEVRAGGTREDGQPWRVAVERPRIGRREMEVAVPLVNSAIATAGGQQKFYVTDGKRYSHIIAPTTGRPIEHTLASVTVVADTCLEADSWDTPLLVMGPVRGLECAEKHGVAAMFVSAADGGSSPDDVQTTSAWRERFAEEK